MSVKAGGTSGVTYVDLTTTTAANVTTVFSPAITDTANVMSVKNAKFIGSSGVQTVYGLTYTSPATVTYTFTTNTANATVNIDTLVGYSPGTSNINIVINSGIYVYSTSTGTPALTIIGGKSGDSLTITNNGYIMGMGGAGGTGGYVTVGGTGNSGGDAIYLATNTTFNVTINNSNASAYIGGGGGGGVAGLSSSFYNYGASGGGGGAGGGSGGSTTSFGAPVAGPTGGNPGSAGNNGTTSNSSTGTGGNGGGAGGSGATWFGAGSGGVQAGGAGGRIFPGTGGTGPTASNPGGQGGNGGSGNSAGSNGVLVGTGTFAAGGGGGWGASGGLSYYGSALSGTAGVGGKAVALNGNTVTWTSGDTTRVYGAVA